MLEMGRTYKGKHRGKIVERRVELIRRCPRKNTVIVEYIELNRKQPEHEVRKQVSEASFRRFAGV